MVGCSVRVGDGARERVADDDKLGDIVLLALLLGVTLCVGRSSMVKLRDVLMESDEVVDGVTLRELVGKRDAEAELEDDAEVVGVVDHEEDGLWLTVVDTVAELLLDSDVLGDKLGETLLVTVEEMDDVGVVVGDHVTLSLIDPDDVFVLDRDTVPVLVKDGDSDALKLAVEDTV